MIAAAERAHARHLEMLAEVGPRPDSAGRRYQNGLSESQALELAMAESLGEAGGAVATDYGAGDYGAGGYGVGGYNVGEAAGMGAEMQSEEDQLALALALSLGQTPPPPRPRRTVTVMARGGAGGAAQDMSYEALLQLEDVRVPACESLVAALPVSVYTTTSEMPGSPGDSNECTICLQEYEDGEVLKRLPCLHRFHEGCIDRWLLQSKYCPVCKMAVEMEDDGQGRTIAQC